MERIEPEYHSRSIDPIFILIILPSCVPHMQIVGVLLLLNAVAPAVSTRTTSLRPTTTMTSSTPTTTTTTIFRETCPVPDSVDAICSGYSIRVGTSGLATFPDLPTALRRAGSGSIILLEDGNYSTALTVDVAGVTICGQSSNGTTLWSSGSYVLQVLSDNVSLYRLSVQNIRYAGRSTPMGAVTVGDPANLSLRISGFTMKQVNLLHAENGLVLRGRDWVLSDNFFGCSYRCSANPASAIVSYGSVGDITVSNNTMSTSFSRPNPSYQFITVTGASGNGISDFMEGTLTMENNTDFSQGTTWYTTAANKGFLYIKNVIKPNSGPARMSILAQKNNVSASTWFMRLDVPVSGGADLFDRITIRNNTIRNYAYRCVVAVSAQSVGDTLTSSGAPLQVVVDEANTILGTSGELVDLSLLAWTEMKGSVNATVCSARYSQTTAQTKILTSIPSPDVNFAPFARFVRQANATTLEDALDAMYRYGVLQGSPSGQCGFCYTNLVRYAVASEPITSNCIGNPYSGACASAVGDLLMNFTQCSGKVMSAGTSPWTCSTEQANNLNAVDISGWVRYFSTLTTDSYIQDISIRAGESLYSYFRNQISNLEYPCIQCAGDLAQAVFNQSDFLLCTSRSDCGAFADALDAFKACSGFDYQFGNTIGIDPRSGIGSTTLFNTSSAYLPGTVDKFFIILRDLAGNAIYPKSIPSCIDGTTGNASCFFNVRLNTSRVTVQGFSFQQSDIQATIAVSLNFSSRAFGAYNAQVNMRQEDGSDGPLVANVTIPVAFRDVGTVCSEADMLKIGSSSWVSYGLSCTNNYGDYLYGLDECAARIGLSSDCRKCIEANVGAVAFPGGQGGFCFMDYQNYGYACNMDALDTAFQQYCDPTVSTTATTTTPPQNNWCNATSISARWYPTIIQCVTSYQGLSLLDCVNLSVDPVAGLVDVLSDNTNYCGSTCVANLVTDLRVLFLANPSMKTVCLNGNVWNDNLSPSGITSVPCLRFLRDAIESFNSCAFSGLDLVTATADRRCSDRGAVLLNKVDTPYFTVMANIGVDPQPIEFDPTISSCASCADEYSISVFNSLNGVRPPGCETTFYGFAPCVSGTSDASIQFSICSGGQTISTDAPPSQCDNSWAGNDLLERIWNEVYACTRYNSQAYYQNCTSETSSLIFAGVNYTALTVPCQTCWTTFRDRVWQSCSTAKTKSECLQTLVTLNYLSDYEVCVGDALVTTPTTCHPWLDLNSNTTFLDYQSVLSSVVTAKLSNSSVSDIVKPVNKPCSVCYDSLSVNLQKRLSGASDDTVTACRDQPFGLACVDNVTYGIGPALEYFEHCAGFSLRKCSESQRNTLLDNGLSRLIVNAAVTGSSIATLVDNLGLAVSSNDLPCMSCATKLVATLSTNVAAFNSTCNMSLVYGGPSCAFSQALKDFESCSGFALSPRYTYPFQLSGIINRGDEIPAITNLDSAVCGVNCPYSVDIETVLSDKVQTLTIAQRVLSSMTVTLPVGLRAALKLGDMTLLDETTQRNLTLIAGFSTIYGGSLGVYITNILIGEASSGIQTNIGYLLGVVTLTQARDPYTVAVLASAITNDVVYAPAAVKALAGVIAYATDGLSTTAVTNTLLALALGTYARTVTRLTNLYAILGATSVTTVNQANGVIDLIRGRSSNICLNVISQGIQLAQASPSAVTAIGRSLTDGRDANETTMSQILLGASDQAVSQADADLVALMMIVNGYSSNATLRAAVPKAFSLALMGSGTLFATPQG